MDPTPEKVEPTEGAQAEPTGSTSADEKPWSPFSTKRARWAWGLMAIFTAIYFVTAILTSAEFAELAATTVLGLPLGFWLGIIVIVSGLIITRIYLAKVEG